MAEEVIQKEINGRITDKENRMGMLLVLSSRWPKDPPLRIFVSFSVLSSLVGRQI